MKRASDYEKEQNEKITKMIDSLSDEQKRAFDFCFDDSIKQKSCFVTGQAGSGKTYLIHTIREYAWINGKKAVITATTAIASQSISGVTLHQFMGIGLGDKDISEHLKNLGFNTKKTLQSIDMVVIDEISMLNPEYFEKCDKLLRIIRNDTITPFGGIQIILFGDFAQLPPVRPGEANKYLFESVSWLELNPKCFALKINHRQQDDPEYAKILSKMRFDELSESDYNAFAKNIMSKKPETDEFEVPNLFPTKSKAESHNNAMMAKIQGDTKIFKAEYTDDKILKSVPVPASLELKVGASVVLCKNLADTQLYNGKMGKIVDFNIEGHPVVKFKDFKNEVTIEKAKWSLTDGRGKEISTLFQIPLLPSYGLTVHKTQGMTLDKVIIHPGFFEAGQAYVAFSRVKTMEGLFFGGSIGFNQIITNKKVKEYYINNKLN